MSKQNWLAYAYLTEGPTSAIRKVHNSLGQTENFMWSLFQRT